MLAPADRRIDNGRAKLTEKQVLNSADAGQADE